MKKSTSKIREIKTPDDSFEFEIWSNGLGVAGVDEVGRGPLAGPVVAAAVMFKPFDYTRYNINDSKRLNEQQRLEAYDAIKKQAVAWAFHFCDNNIIDEINILKASIQAMHNSVAKLDPQPDFLLIDGNYFIGNGIAYKTLVKGDSRSISIAAASIVAKVERDRWMTEVAAELYPEYGFERHKGYPTKDHFAALEKYGPTPIHRRSFLKKKEAVQGELF